MVLQVGSDNMENKYEISLSEMEEIETGERSFDLIVEIDGVRYLSSESIFIDITNNINMLILKKVAIGNLFIDLGKQLKQHPEKGIPLIKSMM